MPLKKLEDPTTPYAPCMSAEHNPPNAIHFEPGTYDWTCPSCGSVTRFIVPAITC